MKKITNYKLPITNYPRRRRAGFTFVELLVAITIIGVLTAVGVVSYQSANKKARDGRRKADMEQIRSALEMYRADAADGEYPAATADLVPDYLQSMPVPPQPSTPGTYGGGYTSPYSGSAKRYQLCQTLEVDGSSYCVYNP